MENQNVNVEEGGTKSNKELPDRGVNDCNVLLLEEALRIGNPRSSGVKPQFNIDVFLFVLEWGRGGTHRQ